jgi:hypothetical protein
MYVMVWKSNEEHPVTSCAYFDKEDLLAGLLETTVGEMPDIVLYWDEEWACSVHTWKEFVK